MIRRLRRSSADQEAGWTLAELGVVVIIIGIIASLALPVFYNQQGKGVDATLKSDVKISANASTGWMVDNPLFAGPTTTSTDSGMQILLGSYGWRKSPNNSVYVITKPNVGYCLMAFNPNSKTYRDLSTSMLYDSAAGGQIARANVPATGACAA